VCRGAEAAKAPARVAPVGEVAPEAGPAVVEDSAVVAREAGVVQAQAGQVAEELRLREARMLLRENG